MTKWFISRCKRNTPTQIVVSFSTKNCSRTDFCDSERRWGDKHGRTCCRGPATQNWLIEINRNLISFEMIRNVDEICWYFLEEITNTRLPTPILGSSFPEHMMPSFSLLPTENIYEFAAKLLFLAVKWPRSISSFLQVWEIIFVQILTI